MVELARQPEPTGCAILMSDNLPCGRPIYPASPGVDSEPLCLMHSSDPQKNVAAFRDEIEAIICGQSLQHRSRDAFDFTRFTFPLHPLVNMHLAKRTCFVGSTFSDTAYFTGTTFAEGADFFKATFVGNAKFGRAKFAGPVKFVEAAFEGEAGFDTVVFAEMANFGGTSFAKDVDFRRATFSGKACFEHGTFTEEARFWNAVFKNEASFGWAKFAKKAGFTNVVFMKAPHFLYSVFGGEANFFDAIFTEGAGFYGATFEERTHFAFTVFGLPEGGAAFVPEGMSTLAIADFASVRFLKPELVTFLLVNKNSYHGLRARFVNCDIEQVQFGAVEWYRQGGRMVLQDEVDQVTGSKEASGHEVVAVTYRRFVNNFEKARAYDLAEDCSIGAMEMKRLDPAQPAFVRLAVNLYRLASNYGSSYQRALRVLALMVVVFGLLFSLVGLIPRPDRTVLEPIGLIHAVEVATFKSETHAIAGSGFAWFLEIFERVLIPAQVALFLLALRRRFRR